MTDARIREAIAWGVSLADRTASAEAYCVGGVDRLTVTTPFLRVALAAQKAAEAKRQFTVADVTPEMIKPVLVVYAPGSLIGPNIFQSNSQDYTEAVNVDAVYVLRPDGTRLEPLSARTTWSEFKREESDGEDVRHSNITAEFPLDALAAGNEVRVELTIKRRIPLLAEALGKLR
jgi:hypothetical protein